MEMGFTQRGDTPQSVTYALFGKNDASYARLLCNANVSNQCCIGSEGGQFAHTQAIWLPKSYADMGNSNAHAIMTHFNNSLNSTYKS